MKKLLNIIGVILGIFLLVAVIGFVYINSNDIPSYPTTELNYTAKSDPASIERGFKLASMLCVHCHLDQSSGKLSGIPMEDAPPEFGKIYAPNITQDRTHGIGEWTDSELLYLLRTGIKKDGQYAPPYMAKLPLMADDDIDAIISFLRSDHILVTPDAKPDKPSDPSFLTKALCRVVMKPFPLPEGKIEMPDTSNTIELGSYLAKNLDCFSCHSADFKTNNFLEPSKSPGYFGGGNKPRDHMGRVILTSNLTPDMETGIGKWTKEEFVKATKFGIKNNGIPLRYPMAPYSLLTDYEAGAIYDYLKTIPAIHNKIERVEYK